VILEEMEKAEGLAAGVKREETDFKAVEAEAKQAQAELDAATARLQANAERLRAERDAVAASIPRRRASCTRGSPASAARTRGGSRGHVPACHVRMRVQIWVEVRKNEQIFQCESCSRIYFYEPPPPTVVAEP